MGEMYAVPGEMLTGIANAIRSKTGSDDFMPVESMASAIESISCAGECESYTKVTAIEIRNDDDHGYSNNVYIPVRFGDVQKIEIVIGIESLSIQNNIVYCGAGNANPFYIIGNTQYFSESIEENGDTAKITLITKTKPDSKYAGNQVQIGSWGDKIYSNTNTFYSVKLYDENDTLLCDLVPAVFRKGIAGFVDVISGTTLISRKNKIDDSLFQIL